MLGYVFFDGVCNKMMTNDYIKSNQYLIYLASTLHQVGMITKPNNIIIFTSIRPI